MEKKRVTLIVSDLHMGDGSAGDDFVDDRHQFAEFVRAQAATPEGSVFVVVDDARMAIATTGGDPTVGLVFYDLKTLLRQTADSSGTSTAVSSEGNGDA